MQVGANAAAPCHLLTFAGFAVVRFFVQAGESHVIMKKTRQRGFHELALWNPWRWAASPSPPVRAMPRPPRGVRATRERSGTLERGRSACAGRGGVVSARARLVCSAPVDPGDAP